MLRIELLVACRTALGEGPLWDVKEERLYWLDSHGPTIFRCDARGGHVKSWSLPEKVGSMALREKGGAVLALESGLHFFDFDTGALERIAEPQPGNANLRMNDGKVDRQGRFVAGYMDKRLAEPIGNLYRLEKDLSVSLLDSGFTCSNGPCWSPDGATFYFSDSPAARIYAYDYDGETGAVSNRRLFADFAAFRGYPDGATVDAEGFMWSSEIYSGRLVRFAPDGTIDRVVGLPVATNTSLMFGGPELDTIYVTTAAQPIRDRKPLEKEAGGLFAISGLGIRGLPEPRFCG